MVAAGVNTRFRYEVPGSTTKLHFRSAPQLLSMQILIGVLEPILDAKNIETLSKAKCFHDVLTTAQSSSLNVSKAASLVGAFLSCVGEIVKLSPQAAVVVAMLAGIPQAFAGVFIGLAVESTGLADFTATIEQVVNGKAKTPSSNVGPLAVGQTAHLAYFDVTVDDHRLLPGLWGARVKVCYTHPHPSANADGTTRVSTDPWEFGFGPDGGGVHYDKDPTIDTHVSDYWKPAYGETRLALGQCHSGWVTVGLVEGAVGFRGMRYAPSDFPISATWQW